jgi:hypothetical protein
MIARRRRLERHPRRSQQRRGTAVVLVPHAIDEQGRCARDVAQTCSLDVTRDPLSGARGVEIAHEPVGIHAYRSGQVDKIEKSGSCRHT